MSREPRYQVVAFYDGFDTDGKDVKIIRAAKREHTGSGFGIEKRDISFDFHTRTAAEKAAARINKIRGVFSEVNDIKDK